MPQNVDRSQKSTQPNTKLAEILSQWVAASERAIVVGNRAGIVEWANESWTRITGRAPLDTVQKPVADFLLQAELDADVVDFVQASFLRGARCEVEFPFAAPDGNRLWIHLTVDPIRDRLGEIEQFVAVAEDITLRKRQEAERAVTAGAASPTPPLRRRHLSSAVPTPIDLSSLVERRVLNLRSRIESHTQIDLHLPKDLPQVLCDPAQLEGIVHEVVRDAAEAIGEDWGTISVTTGVAHQGGSLRSATFPQRAYLKDLQDFPYAYLEVHDTAPELARAQKPASGSAEAKHARFCERSARLAIARTVARAYGGELLVDTAVGCGTRVLLLLPA